MFIKHAISFYKSCNLSRGFPAPIFFYAIIHLYSSKDESHIPNDTRKKRSAITNRIFICNPVQMTKKV
jgi:hypothetical protein